MAQQYFVSVQEAIQKGKQNLFTIPRIITYSGFAISTILGYSLFWKIFKNRQEMDTKLFFSYAAIGLGALILAFIWRNLHSAAWKIWALENVKDIHRLYQLAEKKNMISARGGWLEVFEYRSREQKEQLAELENRLDKPREMEGVSDSSLPEERIFRYSPKLLLLQLAMLIPFLAFAKYGFQDSGFSPMWIFLIFFVGVYGYRWIPRLTGPAPLQLTRSSIQVKDNSPVSWKNVTNAFLENRKQGKSSITVLVIETTLSATPIELDISELEGSDDDLEQAVYDFWARGR